MLNWLLHLFHTQDPVLKEPDPMKKFLIVGLGNIGLEYENTRHNIGFKILDEIAQQEAIGFSDAKLGAITSFRYKGRSILCLKPSTFMNLSGKAVRYWMEKEGIPLENILIITDDINLSFGTIRLKAKGSDGGHNGLKSIQQLVQSTKYHRFRFGVGSNFGKGQQVDYVLGKWNEEEEVQLKERLQKSVELVRSFVFAGPNNTMNQFNGS